MTPAGFFRSLSLTEDLASPARFEHYRPTRRAMPIIDAITSGGSAMVIAPYGSGKSLAAGIAALHVRNAKTDRATLRKVMPRLGDVDAAMQGRFAARLSNARKGLVVALVGHVTDPLAAIADAISAERIPRTFDGLTSVLAKQGYDHVAIVWDEFGRHLEGLIGDGRADELDVVQRLAEKASRAGAPTISLTLLLHQNLMSYASRLTEASRTEWRKVEGRFRAIRLVEDSQEIYGLIGDVVESLRPVGTTPPRHPHVEVRDVIEAKWLDGLDDAGAVERVLSCAHPLTAGALQVLPTLVARIGQNERSLFTFLREADLTREVGIETVWAAFSDGMRNDVGVGGSYRRWLETESARSRAADALQKEILAAACFLQLGVSGERRRLPRRVLELAASGGSHAAPAIATAVDDLIAAKLLLWRRQNDDVAVWHGADIDVALRLREERDRRSEAFDLKAFLEARFPAPYLRAPRHNAHRGVNRFFAGRYQTPAEVEANVAADPSGQDGTVVYVLATRRSEIERARTAASAMKAVRTVHVVPLQALAVESAALELVSLEALKADRAFMASDPMVATEIAELESVAFEQLATLMRGLLDPRGGSSAWYCEGERLKVSGDQPASVFASILFDRWFSHTPCIANEQLMRTHASRTMQTARVRVVGAILERHDRDRLGYEAGDRGPEGSIYRTVLERTGIHRNDAHRFADVEEFADNGLRLTFQIIEDFFRMPAPDGRPKKLEELTETLRGEPLGLPTAVMPLLVAAGYRRFARVVGLYRDGVYMPDLLGYTFDQMVMDPSPYTVEVRRADIPTNDYLREVCYAFVHERPGLDAELVRSAWDAISRWRATIPDGARRTSRLSPKTQAMLSAVLGSEDPLALLLDDLPRTFGAKSHDGKVVAAIERARKEIDRLHDVFAQEAIAMVELVFRMDRAGPAELIETIRTWADCFDAAALEGRQDLRISDKAVFRKARETANGRFSPKSLAGALSSILLQRGLEKWDDRTPAQFRGALRETRERIEAAALDTRDPQAALRPVILARRAELDDLLSRLEIDPASPAMTVMDKRNVG